MALSLTQKWLRDNVQPYSAPDRVYADVDGALSRFPSLRPKSDVYTYDDGRVQLLLCVHGLLPISYRGNAYHIPVAIWIQRSHPQDPPLAYVVPTADMLVRPGPHLDPSGRLGIEYLQQWVRKSEGCSVSGLVEAMQGEFGRSPPVYAKPHGPPVLPPKPMQTQSPAPGPSPAQIPSPALAAPAQAPPNYQLPPRPPPPPPPPNPTPYQPQPSFVPQQFAPQPQYPPAPPPPVVASPPIPNLLDADEAPALGVGSAAPPVPPNPQIVSLHNEVHAKLSSSLASLSTALALDAERLRAHQGALLAGEPAIRDEMARLEAVRDVCNGVVGRVGAVVSGAESWVNDVRGRGEPSVDELVCGVSIVGNQVVNLVAEDNAIEDTIFHLSKALNSGRIDLERFLRSTRLLAEEQFMKRALIEKINANMPVGQPAGY